MSDPIEQAVDALLAALNDSVRIEEQHFLEGFLAGFLDGATPDDDPDPDDSLEAEQAAGARLGLQAAAEQDSRECGRIRRLEGLEG